MYDQNRYDIVERYEDKKYINTGFRSVIDIRKLPKGVYDVYLLFFDIKQHIAKTKKNITIE